MKIDGKSLMRYVKSGYSDRDLCRDYIKGKIQVVSERILLQKMEHVFILCDHVKAAGFTLVKQKEYSKGIMDFDFEREELTFRISTVGVDSRSYVLVRFTLGICNEYLKCNWYIDYYPDLCGYLRSVINDYPVWKEECRQIVHEASVLRKRLSVGETAVRILLEDMAKSFGRPYRMYLEDYAWKLEIKLKYRRALRLRVNVESDIEKLKKMKDRIQTFIDASDGLGQMSSTLSYYGDNTEWINVDN